VFDIDTLQQMMALRTAEAVGEQKRAFDQGDGKNCSSVPALRFATDDFVVGYSVGMTLQRIRAHGHSVQDPPWLPELLSNLRYRLDVDFPAIDVKGAYRSGNDRLSCGILLGLADPGRNSNYVVLEQVWGIQNVYQLAPGSYLSEFMQKNFNLTYPEALLVHAAGDEMHRRFLGAQGRRPL
jgi:hypothetical protein